MIFGSPTVTSPGSRPIASLSLDLDNEWSYLKTHGDSGWQELPSYLDLVIPRVLAFLAARDLRITFFVVGQDAALDCNREALASLATAGHEIANHSFRHEPWMHRYSPREVDEEIGRAEDAIECATSARTVGFRGPGYSLSPAILEVLAARGYLYDASTLPTVIGPLARAIYFRSAHLTGAEREQRADLFGSASECLRPIRPYRWAVGGEGLVEVPVTTLPLLRVPVHVSYLLALSSRSKALAIGYLRTALSMCRAMRVQPSILLHPLDFLGADDVASLAFFPGMAMRGEEKIVAVGRFLDVLCSRFDVRPMLDHANVAAASPDLPVVVPGHRRPRRGPRRPTGGEHE
ncbi:MAG: polysaccharide deacetylase family protein [Acidimicrobiia bacterium]|nr:polysaccharide deacetylase family protein [Acidimicrobiia bacterium]